MTGTEIYSDTFHAFGGKCDLVFTGIKAAEAKKILQKIKTETEQLENVISITSLISDVRNLNHSETKQWVEADPVFLNILSLCNDFYTMSNGAFDVTDWPLYDLWKKTPEPNSDQIEKARLSCGFDKLEIDSEQKLVRFLHDGMKLNFSTIEKAFTAENLKILLDENEVKNCIISFGEEVILALGEHPENEPWPIGIRNLLKPDEFLHVFQNRDRFTVTAGTVYYDPELNILKERRIISPASGLPVAGRKTVSVSGTSATLCAFIAHSWLILSEHDQSIISEQLTDLEIFETEYTDDDIITRLTILNDEQNMDS